MEKKDLIDILSPPLKAIGFNRKGNYWIINGGEITKMVNLQKSQFGNLFYINYGYIINSIPLGGFVSHTFARIWTSSNDMEKDLLNLGNSLSNEFRKSELGKVIMDELIPKLQLVNSELDLLEYIKTLPTLNAIPLAVKKHFNLE